ncbi:MAG: hypothetical protein J7K81_02545 [Methanophagales archaeon]|nr:hypothetical protein [Methanophagales archaeon]
MNAEMKGFIKEELLHLLKEDREFKFEVFEILSATFVTKEEISKVLDEIKSLRNDFNAMFEEHSIAIKELTKRVEEHS